jgi:hypothetical protein
MLCLQANPRRKIRLHPQIKIAINGSCGKAIAEPVCFYQFFRKYSIVVPLMSEQEQEKKRKKKKHLNLLETERVESELLPELMKDLEELEKEKKYVDIQVCPKCKSPLVRRVGSMLGDTSGHMGLTPPKYECCECGWRERTVLKATNRPTSVKDVVIMAEAKDVEDERRRKETKKK